MLEENGFVQYVCKFKSNIGGEGCCVLRMRTAQTIMKELVLTGVNDLLFHKSSSMAKRSNMLHVITAVGVSYSTKLAYIEVI